MALKIVPYWTDFVSVISSTIFLFCIMAKSKISAPVGFFNAKHKPQNPDNPQIQETPAICQSLGFSLELIPSGKFVTAEFINKRGEVSRYNGRTGVKKYIKLANFSHAEQGDYFILWVRRGGVKFDSVAMIHKRRIVKLSAGGVVLWQNPASRYAKTV